MKLKLWNKKNVASSDEDQLFLRLVTDKGCINDFYLICCDKEGNVIDQGNLLVIDQDLKCVVALENINNIIPLKTDINNALIMISIEEAHELTKKKMMGSFRHAKSSEVISFDFIKELKEKHDAECPDCNKKGGIH